MLPRTFAVSAARLAWLRLARMLTPAFAPRDAYCESRASRPWGTFRPSFIVAYRPPCARDGHRAIGEVHAPGSRNRDPPNVDPPAEHRAFEALADGAVA